jgi:chemotaxis protein MotB
LQAQLEEVQAELMDKETSLLTTQDGLESVRAEAAQLLEAQKALEASINDLEKQLAAAQSESSVKSSEVEALQKRLEKSQREAAEGRDALAKKENELAETQGHLEAWKLETESISAQAANAASEAEAREAALISQVQRFFLKCCCGLLCVVLADRYCCGYLLLLQASVLS